MIITDVQKFYKNLAKRKTYTILANLEVDCDVFLKAHLKPQYIICDAEHYQYFLDEMNMYMSERTNQISNAKTIKSVYIQLGGTLNVIIRTDHKGINVFAKTDE